MQEDRMYMCPFTDDELADGIVDIRTLGADVLEPNPHSVVYVEVQS